jgi:hypothetical protein
MDGEILDFTDVMTKMFLSQFVEEEKDCFCRQEAMMNPLE